MMIQISKMLSLYRWVVTDYVIQVHLYYTWMHFLWGRSMSESEDLSNCYIIIMDSEISLGALFIYQRTISSLV